ncbi:hypothetical protein C366_05992, partial [Cryptococcus neoformans Tu401-1]
STGSNIIWILMSGINYSIYFCTYSCCYSTYG